MELVLVVAIVGVLATLAHASYRSYLDRAKVMQAVADIQMISTSIARFGVERNRLPADLAEIGKDPKLDPWGHPYDYINHATANRGQFRKDKNIVPINTDFDLGSRGKDGASSPPLTAQASRDDIIRANDGAFVGMASDYDP